MTAVTLKGRLVIYLKNHGHSRAGAGLCSSINLELGWRPWCCGSDFEDCQVIADTDGFGAPLVESGSLSGALNLPLHDRDDSFGRRNRDRYRG